MSFRIYLSPPDVGPLQEEYVLDALRSGWVAPLGPHVDAFEREIAEFVGVDTLSHCRAVRLDSTWRYWRWAWALAMRSSCPRSPSRRLPSR